MNIVSLRKSHGYTQSQLAKKIQLNQTSISKYEKCKAVPTLENMQKLADALEVDLQTIVNCFVKTEQENSKNEESI